MVIDEVDYSAHAARLESLFRAYHVWNKALVIEALGGEVMPVERLEAEYDIEAVIDEDDALLTDSASPTRLFVARQRGAVVGCVYLLGRSAAEAEVKRLYVEPAARGVGLGRALMESVIEAAREERYESLLLHTGPLNAAALALYDDLGFEPTVPFPCEVLTVAHDDWLFRRLSLEAPD